MEIKILKFLWDSANKASNVSYIHIFPNYLLGYKMRQLSKLFVDTWVDFKKLYLKKMRCKRTEENYQLYGWFWNEFDVRFHFSKMFYDKVNPQQVWLFTDHIFKPSDWEDELKDKMQEVLEKLGIVKDKKKVKGRYPRVDLVVRRPEREDIWAEICADFKFFNVIRKLTPQQREDKLEKLEKDFRRLDAIKSKGLVNTSFMCVVDEYYYWERNHDWRERFRQLEKKYTRAKLLHFKVPKREIEAANAKGIR